MTGIVLPDPEQLKAILADPAAPPRITLDITASDGPETGIVHVWLDDDGELAYEEV